MRQSLLLEYCFRRHRVTFNSISSDLRMINGSQPARPFTCLGCMWNLLPAELLLDSECHVDEAQQHRHLDEGAHGRCQRFLHAVKSSTGSV